MKFSYLFDEINLSNKYIEKLLKNNSEYRYCSNFYDPFTNQIVPLPIKIINLLTHSNGLCSGNSKNEALVQGICEIFERYCYKQLLLSEKSFPTINIDNINEFEIYEQISQISSLGFSYEIKDCSLNGKFPVVGLIIYDTNRENYLFSIGSDPDFNIALQRCITEIFQGLTYSNIKDKMKKINNDYYKLKNKYSNKFINENWLKCYTSNNGIHPLSFFKHSSYINLSELPFSKFSNNKEALKYIYMIIKNNNLKLYIKDYSYLGFDTYKIYIPNISEIENLDETDFSFYSNLKILTDIYYNPYTIDKEENMNVKVFNKILYKMYMHPKYSRLILPSKAFNVNNYIVSNYTTLNYFYLLLITLISNKQYNKCIELLNFKINNFKVSNYETSYLLALKYFLLEGNFPSNFYNESIKNDIKKLVSDPKKYLKNLDAPSCPQCKQCSCRKNCKYKNWKRLNELLNKKYKTENPK